MTGQEKSIRPASNTDLMQLAESTRRIGQMREDWHHPPEELDKRGLIHPKMRDKLVLDQFRNLRTYLLNRNHSENATTLVSSVGQNSDAGMVALNLAIAYSLDTAKTALLVDCNLNGPHLDEVLGITTKLGLTDCLVRQDVKVGKILYQTGIPRMRLVPVGQQTESSSEFFTSLRMHAFLEMVKKRYPDRFVILSAPPLDSAADSRILTELCHQTLIVSDYGRVDENRLLEAANIVGREKLAGVVLNRVPRPPFVGQ